MCVFCFRFWNSCIQVHNILTHIPVIDKSGTEPHHEIIHVLSSLKSPSTQLHLTIGLALVPPQIHTWSGPDWFYLVCNQRASVLPHSTDTFTQRPWYAQLGVDQHSVRYVKPHNITHTHQHSVRYGKAHNITHTHVNTVYAMGNHTTSHTHTRQHSLGYGKPQNITHTHTHTQRLIHANIYTLES